MWFDSWADVVQVILVGAAAYTLLVVILRVSGKRALSQLNAFDFVVGVALGSILATTLLNSDVALTEGFTALALLVGLQFLVATISAHRPKARTGITSQPALLLAHGHILHKALKRHRLTEAELRQAARMHGAGDLAEVEAVVLESNGTLSVITTAQYGDGSAMQDVLGFEKL